MTLDTNKDFEDQKFHNLKNAQADLRSKTFSQCTFVNCDFTESNFTDSKFTECKFTQTNLSLATLDGFKLQDVRFSESKLVGVDFTRCNTFLFEINFHGCVLSGCNFSSLKLPGTSFKECTVKECDFVDADLTGSNFFKSNLKGSLFHHTNLSKVNLVDAKDFSINPETNKLEKAKVSLTEAVVLMEYLGLIIE